MHASAFYLLALSSHAIAGEWKLHKRDVTVTSTVYAYTTYCPCTTTISLSSSIAAPSSISSLVNSGSLGSPVLTSASATSSITTIPASFSSISTSSSTTAPAFTTSTTTIPVIPSSSTSSAVGPGSTVFLSAASLGDYRTSVLSSHNIHRVNHTATPLVWSDTMAQYAAQIASTCVYAHSNAAGDGNFGQNIGAGFSPAQIAFMISNAMYNGEMPKYPGPYGSDNIDISTFSAWGHFTQIVWADTTSVGCATQYCPNGLANAGSTVPPYFTVCNYFPAGNFLGQWSKVHSPLGQPSVVIVP